MPEERIQFGVDGVVVFGQFDTHQLRVGSIVHVAGQGETAEVCSTPTSTSRPYAVVQVSRVQPEGYRQVALMDRLFVHPQLAPRIASAVGGRITLAEVDEKLDILAHDVVIEDLHKRAFAMTRLKKIEAVLDRIDLVGVLQRPEIGEALWLHYRGHLAYLLLTCFDVLGQNAEWMDFNRWLRSSSATVVAERENAVAQIADGTPTTTVAALLQDAYNRLYSVRQSFYRFVNDLLPDPTKRALLDCVSIKQHPTPPAIGEPMQLGDQQKIDWLFQLRNRYTHEATFTPGLHDQSLPADMRAQDDWWWMGEMQTPTTTKSYAVKRWPEAVEECVRDGLLAYIRSIGPL